MKDDSTHRINNSYENLVLHVTLCPSIEGARKAMSQMSQISNTSSNTISGSTNIFPHFKDVNLSGIFAEEFVHNFIPSIIDIDLGLPSIVTDVISGRDVQGFGRQGCNNSLSVFGFLEFVLA